MDGVAAESGELCAVALSLASRFCGVNRIASTKVCVIVKEVAAPRRNLKNSSISEGFRGGDFQYAQQDERERVEFLILQKTAQYA